MLAGQIFDHYYYWIFGSVATPDLTTAHNLWAQGGRIMYILFIYRIYIIRTLLYGVFRSIYFTYDRRDTVK